MNILLRCREGMGILFYNNKCPFYAISLADFTLPWKDSGILGAGSFLTENPRGGYAFFTSIFKFFSSQNELRGRIAGDPASSIIEIEENWSVHWFRNPFLHIYQFLNGWNRIFFNENTSKLDLKIKKILKFHWDSNLCKLSPLHHWPATKTV